MEDNDSYPDSIYYSVGTPLQFEPTACTRTVKAGTSDGKPATPSGLQNDPDICAVSDRDVLYAKVNKRPSVKETCCAYPISKEDSDGEPAYDNVTEETGQDASSDDVEFKDGTTHTFRVDIEETEASKRCRLDNAEYQLNIDVYGICLVDPKAILYSWPYKFIRRYGGGCGKFVIDVGRRAESGEGVFQFKTTTPAKIQAAVKAGINREFHGCITPSSDEDMYASVNKPKPSFSGKKIQR